MAKGKVELRNGREARGYTWSQIGAQRPERFPLARFDGVEGLADEREGFPRKGIVVKMANNQEHDLLREMIKGAGRWAIHVNGLEVFQRWSRIKVGEHGEFRNGEELEDEGKIRRRNKGTRWLMNWSNILLEE